MHRRDKRRPYLFREKECWQFAHSIRTKVWNGRQGEHTGPIKRERKRRRSLPRSACVGREDTISSRVPHHERRTNRFDSHSWLSNDLGPSVFRLFCASARTRGHVPSRMLQCAHFKTHTFPSLSRAFTIHETRPSSLWVSYIDPRTPLVSVNYALPAYRVRLFSFLLFARDSTA